MNRQAETIITGKEHERSEGGFKGAARTYANIFVVRWVDGRASSCKHEQPSGLPRASHDEGNATAELDGS